MVDRTMWTGNASELLRLCVEHARADISNGLVWAKNPRALAGRLRRAQTFLRTLGIEITFFREGRTGTRMIRVRTSAENDVSTVSIVSAANCHGSWGDQGVKSKCRSRMLLTMLTQTSAFCFGERYHRAKLPFQVFDAVGCSAS